MKKAIIGLVVILAIVAGLVCVYTPYLRDRIFLPQIDKVDNNLAQDVSFAELKIFLDDCQTIQGNPDRGCAEYAEDLHNEAEAQGISAAVVVIPQGKFFDIGFHAINAFDTTDRGIVYVDAGIGYAYVSSQCGIAEKGADEVYRINLQVGEMELWHGSYKTVEPKYVTETLGKENKNIGTLWREELA